MMFGQTIRLWLTLWLATDSGLVFRILDMARRPRYFRFWSLSSIRILDKRGWLIGWLIKHNSIYCKKEAQVLRLSGRRPFSEGFFAHGKSDWFDWLIVWKNSTHDKKTLILLMIQKTREDWLIDGTAKLNVWFATGSGHCSLPVPEFSSGGQTHSLI